MLTMIFSGWLDFVDFLILFVFFRTPLIFFFLSEHMFLDFVFIWTLLPVLNQCWLGVHFARRQ